MLLERGFCIVFVDISLNKNLAVGFTFTPPISCSDLNGLSCFPPPSTLDLCDPLLEGGKRKSTNYPTLDNLVPVKPGYRNFSHYMEGPLYDFIKSKHRDPHFLLVLEAIIGCLKCTTVDHSLIVIYTRHGNFKFNIDHDLLEMN